MAQASQSQMNEFVKVIDEFMQKYEKLISPQTRTQVYASGDPKLISDYGIAVSRGGMLKTNIETVTGIWASAKRAYASVTDVTSTVIGDAIDWLTDLFRGSQVTGNNVGGLGVIQIPAMAWIVGTIAAGAALILSIDRIFVRIEANRIQRDSPGISRERALQLAKSGIGLNVFGDAQRIVVIAALAFGAWLYFGQKK